MTEKIYEELDNAKAEIEKLKSEYRVKDDQCDNLKRSNSDQVKRIQELNLKLEKQAQEIEEKADEVYATKQSLEDLEGKLREKENIIKSFTSANDKLRADFNSKLRECEEERIKIVSSLEEAHAKVSDLEHENRDFIDKIEILKEGIYSVSQKKCANESKMANVSQKMRERGDVFDKLEDEKVKLEEQLKWKNEQFQHLKEAHERLRDNLRAKEKEWDMEKCTFIDELSALKTKLESQFRLSEVLKRRLETCTQSLGHEENKRKCLDIQLSESNFDLEEVKSKLERLTDEKECICKEMECKIGKLEEKNQDLVFSLKELEEYKFLVANHSSTIKKLQNELKTLEQIHDDCSNQSKVKEAEWISRFEKVDGELNSCRLELESKEHRLKEITTKLDDYNSLVLQLTVEKVAMKSTLMEARLKFESLNAEDEKLQNKFKTLEQIHRVEEAEWSSRFENVDAELSSCRLELERKEAEWSSQFEKIDTELNSCRLQSESKEAEWSSRFEKVDAELNSCRLQLKSKELCLKEITTELDDYSLLLLLQLTIENVAMESTLLEARSEIESLKMDEKESHLSHKEITSSEEELVQTKSELMNVCDLLDKANEELADSYCEVNEVEFELQIWKSVAEKLKVNLEHNLQMRREVEASLLAQVAIEVSLKEDLEEKERRINDLEESNKELKQNARLQLAKRNGDELEKWEQEWVTKELEAAILAQLESEKIHEHEKKSLNQLVEEKDKRINNLQTVMSSLEEEFDHLSSSFSSRLAKMQVETNLFHEAWEKIRTTVVLKEIEVQERDLILAELEKEFEKQVRKLSSENENLMDFIGCVSERITTKLSEDGQVMGTLQNIMSRFDENRHVELKDRFDPLKENINLYQHHHSPKRNTVEINVDERSPLRPLNS